MTEAQKAAALVFPGHKFGIDDPDEAGLLVSLGVGGFCLYGGTPEEVAAFTARLQSAAARPLLFSADYEDGVATQCPGGTPLPSNMGLGASGSEALAFQKGEVTAAEARAMGVSWVLAPVCDLATAPANPIVNVRSFSSDGALVARLARAYLRGLRSKGGLGCLKHFPGHGETLEDSHLKLPRLDVAEAELRRRELAPFSALSAEADSVMTGHLVVPALSGPQTPYSLSADVARTLRRDIGFEGLVSTDALAMQAIASNYDELDAALMALRGGSDILLVPARARELLRALGPAVEEAADLKAAVSASYGRLERALARAAAAPAAPAFSEIGGPAHAKQAETMAESCLAWAWGAALPALPAAVSYWEPEASAPEEWLGTAFVAQLRELGVEVKPHQEGSAAETLVVGSFLNPRAYTGRIRYDQEEGVRLSREWRGAGRRVMVSFGSPFVHETFGAEGLCAFSKNDPAQRAAAKALGGRLAVKGRVPVELKKNAA